MPCMAAEDETISSKCEELEAPAAAAMASMRESPVFSVAVVGLGMIGAAACRYLAVELSRSSASGCSPSPSVATPGPSEATVIGIGPAEPEDWSKHTGVFGSHYDQGRLTRIVDPDLVWGKLAARSIASYGDLEKESGIGFHFPVGSLRVSPFYGQPHCSLHKAFQTGNGNGAAVELIKGGEDLRRRFPFFEFGDGDVAVMEHGGAGYVDPRRMVQAQLAVAEKHGASVLRETVVEILPQDDGVQIRTDAGKVIRARKVLVCADAYTNSLVGSVAGGRDLALTTHKVSVLLAEVGLEEQKRLQGMPSFIWRLDSHRFLHSIYACPPVLYPDGKVYLKIGGTVWEHEFVSGHQEIMEWFQGRDWDLETDSLHEVLMQLVPGLKADGLVRKPCIVSYTAHNYPYIDAVDGKPLSDARVFVATGGCGAAAKSSDEIGRVAALLVASGKWTSDLDSSLFASVWKDQ